MNIKGWPIWNERKSFRYIDYVPNNTLCSHVVISQRAKAGIISEVILNNSVETGGVFLGYIKNSVWYVVECLDPGISTKNTTYRFSWDADYVNHLFHRVRNLYNVPLSILGFWHRHPDSMDFFSDEDKGTIDEHLKSMQDTGLLSMLVNIDPDFRMTFYHVNGDHLMKVGYDIGDEYFPDAAFQFVSEYNFTAAISNRGNIKPGLAYNRIVPLSDCENTVEETEQVSKNPSQCKGIKENGSPSPLLLNEEIPTKNDADPESAYMKTQAVETLVSKVHASYKLLDEQLQVFQSFFNESRKDVERVLQYIKNDTAD